MSHKIIKPEGIELIEYLNNGYAICNRCGAVMRQTEDPKTGCGYEQRRTHENSEEDRFELEGLSQQWLFLFTSQNLQLLLWRNS